MKNIFKRNRHSAYTAIIDALKEFKSESDLADGAGSCWIEEADRLIKKYEAKKKVDWSYAVRLIVWFYEANGEYYGGLNLKDFHSHEPKDIEAPAEYN